MYKYLVMTKGASSSSWHSWGVYVETLQTVKSKMAKGIRRGLKESEMLVFESKSISECVYRIKQYIGGKWVNTPWINVFNDVWMLDIYQYAEENITDYIKYIRVEMEDGFEVSSMIDWVLRNTSSMREFILWLWTNNKIDKKEK